MNIRYPDTVNHPQPLEALNRYRLPLSVSSKAVTLSVANGASGGAKAFVAFVQFRDEEGSLILPPYQGFGQSDRGAAYFYVSGGEARIPAVTSHSFTPPPRAATLQIELRPWASRDRPQLVAEPRMIEDAGALGVPASSSGVYFLSVSKRTRAVTLSLKNGHQGAGKAFVAAVRFLGEDGSVIQPPYVGFAASDKFRAYFYVRGGKADVPSTTTHSFAPPSGAATMEIGLHPWHAKEKARLAAEPITVSDASGGSIQRRAEAAPRSPKDGADALAVHFTEPPMGSQIAERMDHGRMRISGIVGEDLKEVLGLHIVETPLPFDSYDKDWERTSPSHLVIDVAQLSQVFGWENALTLRDPAATAEMSIMLEKARAAGICTVLILPEQAHRYPLMSRIAHLFDITLQPGEAQLAKLRRAHDERVEDIIFLARRYEEESERLDRLNNVEFKELKDKILALEEVQAKYKDILTELEWNMNRAVKGFMIGTRGRLWKARLSTADQAKLLLDTKFLDADWYLSRYPDVAAAGMDPAVHYVLYGVTEGRLPRPELDI